MERKEYKVGQRLRLVRNFCMNFKLKKGAECKIIHISEEDGGTKLHLLFDGDINGGYKDEYGANQFCHVEFADLQFEIIE